MNLDFLKDYYIFVVIVACLVIGYVMKNFMPTDNKWIPLTVTIAGAILACLNTMEVTVMIATSGAFSGLVSTGLHQVFKQIIDGTAVKSATDDEETVKKALAKEAAEIDNTASMDAAEKETEEAVNAEASKNE
jgi:phosphotransferase system  glucose/maltose/N-acetylglucosamine-specific IIC component